MKCPKCGRENVDGAPFCADCGKSLFPVSTRAEASPVEAQPETDAGAVPTPIISDGAIYIGPMTDPAPEPDPVPDPEPVSAFVQAFGAPAEPASDPEPATEPVTEAEVEVVAETAAVVEPEAEPEPEPEPEAVPDLEPPAPADGLQANAPVPAPAASLPTPPPPGVAPQAASSEPVSEPEPEAAAEPESEAAPVAASAAAPESEAAPDPNARFAPFADAPIVPPNPARAHQTHPQPGGEALYRKGCLAAAWDDIIQTKGWFGKILLLGLVSCVPILNFFVLGYAMRWSRQLFLGKVEPMPQQIFGNRMFVNGFFAFVFSLVLGICVGICGFILEFIPILGMIAYLALALLVSAFEYVAIMRIAVADRLGAGFDLVQVWQTCKRNFSALCCATIVPVLIIGAITTVIVFALSLIIGLPLLGGLFQYANSITSWSYSDLEVFNLIIGMLMVMLPLFLVVYIVASFISAFQQVLIMRATGHFVARYAQEWKSEQAVMSTAHINGD